ncbi:hypothetical protein [Chryseobacterium herbae]|uniref:Uncharacterized protein n=1 Tax=Chryseobacterium herbae TaxID=2976476 RepID=A0ABT2IWI4_9FLAO|nr:hypothetical protein [Chryseobacterium sp. pc1-10]MCT2563208.1 hypothetical protein [Chryseobacterium sp. pc1-10]
MNAKEFINRVVLITLKNKASFEGILIDVSDEWCYLKYIPVDYVVDGYVLISQRYIVTIETADDDGFKENILRLKRMISKKSTVLNIDHHVELLSDLQDKIGIIKIELKDHNKAYIGEINLVREHSFKVHLFSPNATWLQVESFLFKEVRAIYFDEDYINSLRLILPPVMADSK